MERFNFSTLIFLLFLLPVCHSLVATKTITAKKNLREFDKFGFDSGGTLKINAQKSQNSDVVVFGCSNRAFARLINLDPNPSLLCTDQTTCEMTWNTSLVNPFHFTIQDRDFFHFLILSCTGAEVSVKLEYEFLNPGGEQLSLGDKPLPIIYMVLTALWGTLFLTWVGLCVVYRASKTPLHVLLGGITLSKLVVVSVALAYWKHCADTGSCLEQLRYLQSFFFAVSETAFFGALLMVAKGWKITRRGLPTPEIRTISVALILLLSTLLFFSFYSDGYYFLSLMIMYFFMLPKIFTSITRNTRSLESHLEFVQRARQSDTGVITTKLELFKSLRTAVIIYLGTILVVNSLRIIMIWYLQWLNFLLNDLVILLMLGFVSYLTAPFRDRVFSSTTYFDTNVLGILNIDELFSEHEQPLLAPDMTQLVVIEYPYEDKSLEGPIHPNTIPVALGTLDQPKNQQKDNNLSQIMQSAEKPIG